MHLSTFTILQPNAWPAGSKEIVLSFDDGPSPVTSARLLDVLHQHRIRATFCLIGSNAEKYPELAARMIQEGHEIAGHTYHHAIGSLWNRNTLSQENTQWIKLMASLGLSTDAIWRFRPPLGIKTPAVHTELRARGWDEAYLTCFINDAATETAASSAVMTRIKKALWKHQGGAIVLHEMRYRYKSDNTAIDKSWLPDAVDNLIRWALENGFTFQAYPQTSAT